MKTPTPDNATECLILELGNALSDCSETARTLGRTAEAQPSPEQVDSLVARIVAAVRPDPKLSSLLGISPKMDNQKVRMRVSAVACVAWQSLRADRYKVGITTLAALIGDPRALPPSQAFLVARQEVGLLITDKVLLGWTDAAERPVYSHVMLATRALVYLSGESGYLTVRRMADAQQGGDGGNNDNGNDKGAVAGGKGVPSARQLFETVREKVIGCDPQLRTLTSRIALAVARADMLAQGGRDTGVGNQVLVVFGSSGTGKTYAIEEIARASGLVFSSFDASGISGLGWAGSSVEDALKVALMVANGDAKRASRAVICYDEIDKVLRAGLHEHKQSAQADLLRPLGGHTIIIGGKKNFDGGAIPFNCAPTTFVLSGVFAGLLDIAKRRGRQTVGFNCVCVEGEKAHADLRHALHEYGCLEELCGRISAFVQMPEPSTDSIARAVVSEHGVIQGFNRVLASRGVVLYPEHSGVSLLADHAIETRTFFRGAKHLVGGIVEEILFDETTGTVMLDAALVRRAIDRAGGIADPCPQHSVDGTAHTEDTDADLDTESGSVLTGG